MWLFRRNMSVDLNSRLPTESVNQLQVPQDTQRRSAVNSDSLLSLFMPRDNVISWSFLTFSGHVRPASIICKILRQPTAGPIIQVDWLTDEEGERVAKVFKGRVAPYTYTWVSQSGNFQDMRNIRTYRLVIQEDKRRFSVYTEFLCPSVCPFVNADCLSSVVTGNNKIIVRTIVSKVHQKW